MFGWFCQEPLELVREKESEEKRKRLTLAKDLPDVQIGKNMFAFGGVGLLLCNP